MNKYYYIFIGFALATFLVVSGYVSGCQGANKNPPKQFPTSEIKDSGKRVGDVQQTLGQTTNDIKKNAEDIKKETPANAQPIVGPKADAILKNVATQEELVKELGRIKDNLSATEKKAEEAQASFNAERQERLKQEELRKKAEENIIKEYKRKIMGWSALCFFGMLVCGAAAAWSRNKAFMALSIVCGVGLGVCVFLIQTISLIPWVIGGLLGVGFLMLVYQQYSKYKETKKKDEELANKEKIAKELVKSQEAAKPFMTEAGRRDYYGDGPIPGKIVHLLSEDAAKFVSEVRNSEDFKKAPSIKPTIAADLNNDGVVTPEEQDEYDRRQLLLPSSSSSSSTVEPAPSPGKIGGPRKKIILH